MSTAPSGPPFAVTGTFAADVPADTLVGSYDHLGSAGDEVTLVADCAGYAPRPLAVWVSLGGVVLAQGFGRVSLTLPADGTYTVQVVA